MRVGFIGLGAMGLPMAKNIIKRKYPVVTMCHHRREPAEELASMGAQIVETPKEIAQDTDVIITVLPADSQLKEVVLGEWGLITGLQKGKVLIDMTTATPLTLRAIQEQLAGIGVPVLDAPVSGGTGGAAEGKLTIMVGGQKEILDQYLPLLKTMGTKILHVGPVGQGKVVKMINQLLAAIHLLAIGESFALGVKCGADMKSLYEVIKASSGHSKMMDLKLDKFIFQGTYSPGFTLKLMIKDINLAIDSAREVGTPLLFGSLASQLLSAVGEAGHGDEDFSVAAEFLANMSQVQLRPGMIAN